MIKLITSILLFSSFGYLLIDIDVQNKEIKPLAVPVQMDTTFILGSSKVSITKFWNYIDLEEANESIALFEKVHDTISESIREREFYSDTSIALEKFYKIIDGQIVSHNLFTTYNRNGQVAVCLDFDKNRINEHQNPNVKNEFNELIYIAFKEFEKIYGKEFSNSISLDFYSSIYNSFILDYDDKTVLDIESILLDFNLELIDGKQYSFQRMIKNLDSKEIKLIKIYPRNLKSVTLTQKDLKTISINNGLTENIEPFEYKVQIDSTESNINILIESIYSIDTIEYNHFEGKSIIGKIDLHNGNFSIADTLCWGRIIAK